jgi:hypothetical protein
LPVFSTVSTTRWGRTLVVTHTLPCSGRLWTIAFCTRFVASCSRSACEPTWRKSLALAIMIHAVYNGCIVVQGFVT